MFNKIFLYTIIFLFSFNCFSQKEGWLIGHSQVIEKALKEKKPIMVNFTGSDWCGWCIRLDQAVFQTNEFKKWAKENVILLEIDDPRRTTLSQIYGISEEEGKLLKQENENFRRLFQVRGFPTVYVFSVSKRNDGKISITTETSGPYNCRMGYMASATQFIEKAEKNIERVKILERALQLNLSCTSLSNEECEKSINKSNEILKKKGGFD